MGEETREAALGMFRETPEPESKPAPEPEKKPAAGAEAAREPAKEPGKEPAGEAAKEDQPAAPAGEQAKPEALFEPLKAELGDRCTSYPQMRAQLEDAWALYDICFGKAEPDGLCAMLKMYPEAFAKVAAWFAKNGGAAAAPGSTAKPGEKKEPDPINDRLTKLEQEREEQQKQAVRKRVVDGFLGKVKELAGKAELDDDDQSEYADAISAAIGRDPAALKRVEAGDWRDVERLFNERHGRLQERFKKRSDALIAGKQSRDRTMPKSPAGGAPPAPAGAKRPNFSDRESRTAAALEEFRN